jgi:hypothetical protein
VPIGGLLHSAYRQVRAWEQDTLITDLLLDVEALLSRFNETTRYQIRRAERLLAEDNRYTVCAPGVWLEQQKRVLCSFLAYKNIDPWVSAHGLENYPLEPFLLTSSVDFEGISLVVHSYLVDKQEKLAWLHWSASQIDTAVDRKVIGWLNRFLHWRDIVWFRDNGYVQYDWGGAGRSPEVANITRFKIGFGGMPAKRYHALVAHRLLAPALGLLFVQYTWARKHLKRHR